MGVFLETVSHDGTVNKNIYDAAGRLVLTIFAEGTEDEVKSFSTFNAFGDALGAVGGVGADTLANNSTGASLNAAIDQYGNTVVYDGLGRTLVVKGPAPEPGAPQSKTYFYYDDASRIRFAINALGEVTETLYNAFGQVTEVRQLINRIPTNILNQLTGGDEHAFLSLFGGNLEGSLYDAPESVDVVTGYQVTFTAANDSEAIYDSSSDQIVTGYRTPVYDTLLEYQIATGFIQTSDERTGSVPIVEQQSSLNFVRNEDTDIAYTSGQSITVNEGSPYGVNVTYQTGDSTPIYTTEQREVQVGTEVFDAVPYGVTDFTPVTRTRQEEQISHYIITDTPDRGSTEIVEYQDNWINNGNSTVTDVAYSDGDFATFNEPYGLNGTYRTGTSTEIIDTQDVEVQVGTEIVNERPIYGDYTVVQQTRDVEVIDRYIITDTPQRGSTEIVNYQDNWVNNGITRETNTAYSDGDFITLNEPYGLNGSFRTGDSTEIISQQDVTVQVGTEIVNERPTYGDYTVVQQTRDVEVIDRYIITDTPQRGSTEIVNYQDNWVDRGDSRETSTSYSEGQSITLSEPYGLNGSFRTGNSTEIISTHEVERQIGTEIVDERPTYGDYTVVQQTRDVEVIDRYIITDTPQRGSTEIVNYEDNWVNNGKNTVTSTRYTQGQSITLNDPYGHSGTFQTGNSTEIISVGQREEQVGTEIVNERPTYGDYTVVQQTRDVEVIDRYIITDTPQRGSTEIVNYQDNWVNNGKDTVTSTRYTQGQFITLNDPYGHNGTFQTGNSTEIIAIGQREEQVGTEIVNERPIYGDYTVVQQTRQVEVIDRYITTTTPQRGSSEIVNYQDNWVYSGSNVTTDNRYSQGDTITLNQPYGFNGTFQTGNSTEIRETIQVTQQTGTRIVDTRPTYGAYTEVTQYRQEEQITGYRTTSTSQRGSTPIYENVLAYSHTVRTSSDYDNGDSYRPYGSSITYTTGDSTAVWSTRDTDQREIIGYRSGPYGSQIPIYGDPIQESYISGYDTPLYRTEQQITGYRTPIYQMVDVPYTAYQIPVYGLVDQEIVTGYSTPIYVNEPIEVITYRTPVYVMVDEVYDAYEVPVYGMVDYEYVSGYRTPLFDNEPIEIITYNTPVYVTVQENYDAYEVPVFGMVDYEYVSGYNTPLFDNEPIEIITYNTPVYVTVQETYDAYEVPVFGMVSEDYVSGYNTPIYRNEPIEIITYNTPVYVTVQENYDAYEIPVYGTVSEDYVSGYSTPIFENEPIEIITYNTPIYVTVQETYDAYEIPVFGIEQQEYVSGYNTPLYDNEPIEIITYRTPVYEMVDVEYTAYEVPVYETQDFQVLTGYSTPLYRETVDDVVVGYTTPILEWVDKTGLDGYDGEIYNQRESQRIVDHIITEEQLPGSTPVFSNNQSEVITGYNTPITQSLSMAYDVVTKTTYNQLGLVATQTDGVGNTTRFEYDQYGQLSDVYSPFEGQEVRTHNVYDRLGRLVQSYADYNGENQLLTQTSYDAFGRVIAITDPNQQTVRTEYTDFGREIVVIDPLNRRRTTRFDALGRQLSVTNALDQTTSYSYDDVNRSVTVTTPEGISISTYTSRTGQTLRVEDGKENTTEYSYNSDGNLETVVNFVGGQSLTTENEYYNNGVLKQTTDANGHSVIFKYDAANRMVEQIVDPSEIDGGFNANALNIVTQYEFDAIGRQVLVRNAAGVDDVEAVTQYIYDNNGRVSQVISDPNGLGLSTKYVYNDAGNQVRVERGSLENTAQQVTEYIYDSLGRIVQEIVDPDAYRYNDLGEVLIGTAVNSARNLNLTTEYRYDANGNVTRVINSTGESAWSVYDDANQLSYSVNALGYVVEFVYDDNGNLSYTRDYAAAINVSGWNGSNHDVKTTADIESQLLIITDNTHDRQTYNVYDDDSRKRFTVTYTGEGVSNTGEWVVTESIFDENGNVVESRRFDATLSNSALASINVENVIVESDLITALQNAGVTNSNLGSDTRRTHFIYDELSRLVFTVNGEGYVTENKYDLVGNVTEQIYYANQTSAIDGSITSSASDRSTIYRYDAANRLTEELSSFIGNNELITSDGNTYSGRIKRITEYNELGQVVILREGIIERNENNLSLDVYTDARTTAYEYDEVGQQVKTTLAGWYDSVDERFHANNAAGRYQRTVEVEYDDVGNAIRNKVQIADGEYSYQYKIYDSIGREIFDIDALGHVTGMVYDAFGNVQFETRYSEDVIVPSNENATPSHDSVLALVNTDLNSRTVESVYDALGRKTSVLLPETGTGRPETNFIYNAFGEVVQQSLRIDSTTTADSYNYYDAIGRVIATVDPEGYGTEIEYDALGNSVQTTEYAVAAQSVSIDNKPTFTSSSEDRVIEFIYDRMGRVTDTIQKGINYVDISLVGAGNAGGGDRNVSITEHNNADLILSRTGYNAFGETAWIEDAADNVTTTTYDNLGRTKQVIEPERVIGTPSASDFDPFLNTAAETPVTIFKYDIFGNILEQSRGHANGTDTITIRAEYDHQGNQIKTWDGENHLTEFGVDFNGRVIREFVDVNVTNTDLAYQHRVEQQYQYDAVGRQLVNLTIYDDVDGTAKQSGMRVIYNSFGEIVQEDKIWGDVGGQLNSAISKTVVYDDAGRVQSTRDISGLQILSYDLAGRNIRVQHGGSLTSASGARVTEMEYDLLDRVTTQRLPHHDGALNGVNVHPVIQRGYDRWGNIAFVVDAAGNRTEYTYNYLNKLVSETGPETRAVDANYAEFEVQVTRNIGYDILGREVSQYHAAYNTRGTAAANDDLLTAEKSSYQLYDSASNVVHTIDGTQKLTSFAYDIHANKIGVRDGAGVVSLLDYDANGQLVEQAVLRQSNVEEVISQTVDIYGSGSTSYSNFIVTKEEYNGFSSGQTANTKVVLNAYRYDAVGNRYAEINSADHANFYEFDSRGNILVKQDVIGTQTHMRYDAFNNKTDDGPLVDVFDHTETDTITYIDHYGNQQTDTVTNYITEELVIGDHWTYSYDDYTIGQQLTRSYVERASTTQNIVLETYEYSYDSFGQMERETSLSDSSFYIDYEYFDNGLLARKSEVHSSQRTIESTYNYDVRGLRTAEVHTTRDSTTHTAYGFNNSNELEIQTIHTPRESTVETYYQYDALGRLSEVSSPAGYFNTDGIIRESAELGYLRYNYDEWGNRRSIESQSRLPGASNSANRAEYFSYDEEGRTLTSRTSLSSENTTKTYTYDNAGRQTTVEQFSHTATTDIYGTNGGPFTTTFYDVQTNFYNDLGLLEEVVEHDRAVDQQGPRDSGHRTIQSHTYDNRGFRTISIVDGETTTTAYRNDGVVIKSETRDSANRLKSIVDSYSFDTDGNMLSYRFRYYDEGSLEFTNTYRYSYVKTYTGEQVSSIIVDSDQDHTDTGETYNTYDIRGRLTRSQITETNSDNSRTGFSTKYFAYNADGQITGSYYRKYGESDAEIQTIFYSNGNKIADIGDAGINITPIQSQYEAGGTPGSYTVNVGDTLTNIAQALFGDASLWYVIAEANGLAMGPTDRFTQTDAGRSLTIPNTNQTLRNNSTTFTPYNPTDIIGDLTPDPEIVPPPPPKSKGCNALAIIAIIVVAVVVTVFTAGAAAVAMSAAAQGIGFSAAATAAGGVWAAGTAVLAGGAIGAGIGASVALAGSTTLATVAAAAIGGFVGSLASQAVGVATGVQDGVSLRTAFASGLNHSLYCGFGKHFQRWSNCCSIG